MPEKMIEIQGYLNYCFTWFFVGELLLKLVGMGGKRYFAKGMNIFDFCESFIQWP